MNNLMANAGGPANGLDRLRVAIVHYWFVGYGGGERVVEAFAEMFPQAEFYTLVASKKGIPPGLRGRRVTTSFMQHFPGAKRWYRHFLPLFPLALEQFDLSGYDLVISSESGPAKGVITGPGTCHLCYCHTPMRYVWDMYHDYRRGMNPLARAVFLPVAHYARQWDLGAAARVDYFAANSGHVSRRIRKYYRRESTVIHPPVNVSAGYLSGKTGDAYLLVSRLVPYKRVDLAIEACKHLGRRLQIVGDGPEYKRLRKLAGPTVEFLGRLGEESLRECYARSRAFLFPAEEDFGIAPVEAQSFGLPVIAYGCGGALETVIGLDETRDPQAATGVFFDRQTPESLEAAIQAFEEVEAAFNPEFIRAGAQRFSRERFMKEFANFAVSCLADFREAAGGQAQPATVGEPARVPANGTGSSA